MAALVELLVAKTAKEYELITRNPGDKLRVKADLNSASKLLKLAKRHHDSANSYDDGFKSEYISELTVDGLDDEQIWQLGELQNEAASRKLLECFSTTSIEETKFRLVSASSNIAFRNREQKRRLTPKVKEKGTHEINRNEEDITADDKSDEAESDVGSEDSLESDEELAAIKKRIKHRDDEDFGLFGDTSLNESEDDTLFKGKEDEDDDGDEPEDDDDEENENNFDFDLPENGLLSAKQNKQPSKSAVKRNFGEVNEVDDKFFKMAEMEEFLEREDKREEKQKLAQKIDDDKEEGSSGESEGESDDIDMFGEWSDEGEEKDIMYGDFFDPPADGEEMLQNESKKRISTTREEEMDNGDEEVSDDDEEDKDDEDVNSDGEAKSGKKKVKFSVDIDDKSREELLSNFQKRNERLLHQIQSLEEQSLQAKPWQMSGEVTAKVRPENSLLEEHVHFEQTAPNASEITEEVTQTIEELIQQRIKDKAFDDNQRQVRPKEEVYELKTEKTLDQEKSKLSLHEVYEQEYLKLQAPEEEETNPEHDEIKKMMAFLFPRLDALASWHYKPTQAVQEIKIKNNLPAIQMEESTPITMGSASVLAPEEVKAKKKGEVKGKSERTKEDKQRERKQKKAAKRQKFKEKDKLVKEVEKQKPGLGNKYSKERALKELKKQSKGNIEVIEEKKSKKSMSSKAFFSQLQEEVTTQAKVKSKTKKEKERKKQKSSGKFLL